MSVLAHEVVVQMLRAVPLFSHARDDDLCALAARVQRVQARRRQLLFRQGDRCEGFHVVVYGRIKMYLLSAQGAERPIQLIGPGGCFGDITMLTGDGYFMNVQALEDSLFLYLPREAIVDVIGHDSAFAMAMLRSLSSRVKGIVEDIGSYTMHPPRQRLVYFLLRQLPAHGGNTASVELDVGKNVVAAHLNLTPETLSRCLKELSDEGIVAVQGRQVLVHDVERLALCVPRAAPVPQGASNRPAKRL